MINRERHFQALSSDAEKVPVGVTKKERDNNSNHAQARINISDSSVALPKTHDSDDSYLAMVMRIALK